MDRASSSSEPTGLLNVGRRSIRRLAHAIQRRRESAAGEASDTPVSERIGNTVASSKRTFNSSVKKPSKKYAFLAATREQEQPTTLLAVRPTAAAGREAGARATTPRRRSSGRKPSRPVTSKVKGKPLASWPFKRSQGRLDIQGHPLQSKWPKRTRSARDGRREARARTASIAVKTCTKESQGRDTRQEGPTAPSGGQQTSRSTSGGSEEESAHWRIKKRRRRRSHSDADEYVRRQKASKQTHVVAAGLATPRRPRMKEKDRRCTPKKLNVKGEEFISLKKKLEWELTLQVYRQQKKEFMEINKDMYE